MSKTKTESFWRWLIANTERIQAAKPEDVQTVSDELEERFAKQYPTLSCDVALPDSGAWQLVVTASGDREQFPAVERAVKDAGDVAGWEVVAFAQPGFYADGVQIDIAGEAMGEGDLRCSIVPRDAGKELLLWVPNMTKRNEDSLAAAALTFVDNALGEYDAGMMFASITSKPLPKATPDGSFPLSELAQQVGKVPPAAVFWDWLRDNTARVQAARTAEQLDPIGQEIGSVFKASFPKLSWEMSIAETGPWQFCVSAEGDVRYFDRVERAVASAPAIAGWKVVAFRQRGALDARIDTGAGMLATEDIWCSFEEQDGDLALTLWIPGLSEETDAALSPVAILLLDNAIGEYDAVTKIHSVERGALPPHPEKESGMMRLTELPAFLDELDS